MKDQQIAALKLELRTVNCYVKEMGELKQLNASREAQHASRIRELKEELRKKELEISDLREQTKQQETFVALLNLLNQSKQLELMQTILH